MQKWCWYTEGSNPRRKKGKNKKTRPKTHKRQRPKERSRGETLALTVPPSSFSFRGLLVKKRSVVIFLIRGLIRCHLDWLCKKIGSSFFRPETKTDGFRNLLPLSESKEAERVSEFYSIRLWMFPFPDMNKKSVILKLLSVTKSTRDSWLMTISNNKISHCTLRKSCWKW